MRTKSKGRFTYTIDKEIEHKFDTYSKKMGMSKSAAIEGFLREFIDSTDKLFSASYNLPDALGLMFKDLGKQIQELKSSVEVLDAMRKEQ